MDEDILNRNRNINRGFRKLEVWNEAIELYSFVKLKILVSQDIPFKVKAQVEDSAFSVHSNIAEGYGRRYLKESIQFNSIALASLAENYSQVYALFRVNIISRELFDEFDKQHYSLENKLINYNKSQVQQLKSKTDWHNDYIVREIISTYGSED
jgi:four helix bundle protein